jgi:hypothetical protein
MKLVAAAIVAMVLSFGVIAPLAGWGRQPQEAVAPPERGFITVDLYIDSGTATLGAYQVELTAAAAAAKLVGVEGGEHAAFSQPPYYDPAALHENQLKERIVLAAFSTAPELPSGRTRVARLHVQATGDAAYEAKLQAAGSREGEHIEAKVEVVPVQ